MVTRGKSINLFLIDGDPGKCIKCTLANWTGVAYKIPRTELEKCKGRDDLSQSGVYFLFGAEQNSDQNRESVVYIGQAGVRKNGEGILYRLQEHKRNSDKDYWNEAVVFTTSNNSFGPTEISYLENRFCNMAINANRYIVKNSNDPTPGNITEEKESELEEFIDYAKIIMMALGHKVFESVSQMIMQKTSPESIDTKEIPFFHIKKNGADAKAQLTNEGIVVLAGSIIRKETVPSCPTYAKTVREYNREYINEDGVLSKDLLFNTPSGASAFVLGSPTNGNTEWKTEDGKTLKEIETNETEEP